MCLLPYLVPPGLKGTGVGKMDKAETEKTKQKGQGKKPVKSSKPSRPANRKTTLICPVFRYDNQVLHCSHGSKKSEKQKKKKKTVSKEKQGNGDKRISGFPSCCSRRAISPSPLFSSSALVGWRLWVSGFDFLTSN